MIALTRIFAVSLYLLMLVAPLSADEPNRMKLAAPAGWGGETIQLPPGFAPDMKLVGAEHIRFAPGMMQSTSDSFFCYAFVFELQPKPELTESVVKAEFLKYFCGLCKAVLNGKRPDVDPSTFTLVLNKQKPDSAKSGDALAGRMPVEFHGTLDWVEPFTTQKPQRLNLEIRTWVADERNFIFACVSPQARDKPIWTQLHAIRDGYLKE